MSLTRYTITIRLTTAGFSNSVPDTGTLEPDLVCTDVSAISLAHVDVAQSGMGVTARQMSQPLLNSQYNRFIQ